MEAVAEIANGIHTTHSISIERCDTDQLNENLTANINGKVDEVAEEKQNPREKETAAVEILFHFNDVTHNSSDKTSANSILNLGITVHILTLDEHSDEVLAALWFFIKLANSLKFIEMHSYE